MGDQLFTAVGAEHQREQRRADQDQEHHGGDVGGGAQHVLERGQIEATIGQSQHQGAEGTHRGSLGGGGQSGQDRAEHRDDQHDGRHQALEQQQADARGVAQLGHQFLAIGGRGGAGLEQRHQADVDDIHQHQDQARDQRPHEQITHRHRLGAEDAHGQLGLLVGAGQHVTEQHQSDGRRDDLTQGAGGADGAGGQRLAVAALEHGRQRHQAHGDHGGADDAGGSGQHHADQGHRDAESAAQRAEQQGHGVEQGFGDLGLLEQHAHQHEQGHRQQGGVGHDAVEAIGEGVEVAAVEVGIDAEGLQAVAEPGKGQGGTGQRQRDRKTEHQYRTDDTEQHQGHELQHLQVLLVGVMGKGVGVETSL